MLSSILLVVASGCGGGGAGCGSCGSEPLPGGALPADQTVEGGGQIRVTPAGFNKISALLESVVSDSLEGGTCIPSGEIGNAGGFLGTGAYYCYNNDGSCSAACDVNVNIDNFNVTPAGNVVNLSTQFDVSSTVPLDYQIVGIGGSCNMLVEANNLNIDADIALDIKPVDGELDIHLDNINNLSFDLNFSNCGLFSDLLSLIGDVLSFLDDFLGDFINGLIAPVIDDLIQGFLPDPIGIEGMTDIGAMVAGVSPGTEGKIETRMVPGGYVNLNNGGMSLGLITGINADEDITTRTGDLDNEPAYCVPPFAAPDFAAAPASLPRQPQRQTFMLAAADEFNGTPNPSGDLAMGISETTLDLLGHHAVTSGGVCMGIGTNVVPQLNLGTIGLLVPSLVELASEQGNDPLLLVTRPQRALDFEIGDGTEASPAITLHIEDLEVDFYAFVFERYTRAFTMSLTLDAGINLEISQTPGQAATIQPILVGLDSDNIQIEVLNSEFVRETPDNLEAILPTVFDLVLPLLADGLPAIAVPEFAGFQLSDLSVQHVQTMQDDFLAIFASLDASPAMAAAAATKGPRFQAFVNGLHGNQAVALAVPAPVAPHASLRSVVTPTPGAVRLGLAQHDPTLLPAVTINADQADSLGRPLEWSWRMAGGLWRPYAAPVDGALVIRDRAFAWQGKFDLELKARVIAAPQSTVSGAIAVHAIVDSVVPAIDTDKADWTGDVFMVPARDMVSGQTLRWAYGQPGADQPSTAWSNLPTVTRADLASLVGDADLGGDVAVFVMDEAGNVATALARTTSFHGQAGEGGCGGCQSDRGSNSGSLVLLAITGIMLAGARRRRGRKVMRAMWQARSQVTGAALLWLGASMVASLVPGCDCSNDAPGQSCEEPADCTEFCDADQIPFCIDNTCVCDDDVPAGRVGPYSDVGVSPDGVAWVSAYAQSWGDLVLASPSEPGRILPTDWEWVDGVPDVAPEIEGAHVRGGITAAGEDVGMYTSVAVTTGGEPRVSYFDREHGALKFAAKVAGAWQTHIVDDGSQAVGPAVAGVYTAISLRTDNGNPGIAYTTYVTEGTTVTAEVWFAAAQTDVPTSAADWTRFLVDSAVLPPADEANPDPFPLPGGLGLFVDVARGPDQAPVVVYYDRTNGDLKLSRLDPVTGTFLPPQIVEGATNDAGWSPSVIVGGDGVIHVAYVAATHDDLEYWNSATNMSTIIDDGYRIVGTTEEGLPKPEFHFVGDDVTITLVGTRPAVVYQDATSQELIEARLSEAGLWTRTTLAGDETPFVGGYGFYASSATSSDRLVISTWVIDLPTEDQWVEVFLRNLSID